MRVYADRPARAVRQFASDLLALLWIVFWAYCAFKVYELVERLAVVGEKLTNAGDGMAGGLSGAGDTAAGVPGVGRALAAPFRQAAGAAQSLATAGTDQQQAVHDLALTLALLLVVMPVGLVLTVWLPPRLRWMRRASLALRLQPSRGGRDLLALRALNNAPTTRLLAIHPDPVGAWRDGDESTVHQLARLELRTLGLNG